MTFDLPHSLAEKMKQTSQSRRWHGEGDVLTHTEMVVDELHKLPEYQELSERQQQISTIAAWMHDIGKIQQSREVGDDIETPNHAGVGSRIAREVLWRNYNMCGAEELMLMRETHRSFRELQSSRTPRLSRNRLADPTRPQSLAP